MEELSGECRKAFPANETSLQAAAVRHKHLPQAISALDMLMLLLGNLYRLQVPKKERNTDQALKTIVMPLFICVTLAGFHSNASKQKH